MPHSPLQWHERPILRSIPLLVFLLLLYAAVYLIARHIAVPKSDEFRAALGIGVAAILMTANTSSHRWLRFLIVKRDLSTTRNFQHATTVLKDLGERAGFPIELRVMQSKRMFVYSAGITQRLVVISTGTLEKLSAEAMTGILAHEVAHMVLTHSIKNAIAVAAFFGLRIAFSIDQFAGLVMVFWLLLYLRTREYEADKVAALMVGKQPVLTALREVRAATKTKEFSRLTEFLISTHPSYGRRELALMSTQF